MCLRHCAGTVEGNALTLAGYDVEAGSISVAGQAGTRLHEHHCLLSEQLLPLHWLLTCMKSGSHSRAGDLHQHPTT